MKLQEQATILKSKIKGKRGRKVCHCENGEEKRVSVSESEAAKGLWKRHPDSLMKKGTGKAVVTYTV